MSAGNANKGADKKRILVTGDVVVDNHIYTGERKTPDAAGRGVQAVHVWGGARLEEGILMAYKKPGAVDRPFDVRFGLQLPDRPCLYSGEKGLATPDSKSELHCYATWVPMASADNMQVWRVKDKLGYGGMGGTYYDFSGLRDDPKECPDIVLLDDAALGFRFKLDGNPENGREYLQCRGVNAHFAWPDVLEENGAGGPAWIVLKMAHPLCCGDLWETLTKPRNRRRLIVVVWANDIRRASVQVSSGFSWERTAMELVRELLRNPALKPLLDCAHLIIPFHSEGAVWVRNASSARRSFHLVLDPSHQEGEWPDEGYPGQMLGFLSCLTASIAAHLATESTNAANLPHTLGRSICAGLSGMRTLFLAGHGTIADVPGFPFERVAETIASCKEQRHCIVEIPHKTALDPVAAERWSILSDAEYNGMTLNWPLMGIAHRVAAFGLGELLEAPYAQYGDFLTADRGEIEALQTLRSLIRQYANGSKAKQPLCIAVFGPPGAGKSFAVKELAKKVIPQKTEKLTFNLSQFETQEDLIDALHQVRDSVLKGNMPLVFWDEFDTGGLAWLKSFLAPMQDGEFSEGQVTHCIGPCIFVFAGGTADTMAAFNDRDKLKKNSDGKTEFQVFKEKKGPDFVSRLSGYLNVRGPNPQPLTMPNGNILEDQCYPVRRATMFRSMLRLKPREIFDMDSDVLSAILGTRVYRNGSRSLEKLLNCLRASSTGAITRSSLPPRDVLDMFVDADDFLKRLDHSAGFAAVAERLGPSIHEYYRSLEKNPRPPRTPKWDLPFDRLPEHIKQDNYAAGMRIVQLLALVGLTVAPATSANRRAAVPAKTIEAILGHHIERLAEQEHLEWMDTKRSHGYRYDANRLERKRLHNAMKPYADLDGPDKDRDRGNVTVIPLLVKKAKHVIIPLRDA